MTIKELINGLGGLNSQPFDDVIAGCNGDPPKYLLKQRMASPDGRGTYNGYDWHFYAFNTLAEALQYAARSALSWDAPGWEHVGLWRIEDGASFEIQFQAQTIGEPAPFRPQYPDGIHKD